ncbi:MAG: hypothetical protein ACREPM_07625 [Gemmatimonadaceae bacterium]
MLNAGSIIGDQLAAGSMARAIEDAMVTQGVLSLDDETPDAAEKRRKTFVAIATGVVTHILGNIEIIVAADKFTTVPAAQTSLLGSAGEVK